MGDPERVTGAPVAADALTIARQLVPLLAREAFAVDEEARFPEASLAALRESGLMGLLIPEAFGGLGHDVGVMVRAAQTLAGGCLSTAMVWAMHCQQVATLVDFAPYRLLMEVLPKIARGEMFVASVTTEAGKGGHLLTALAPLVRSGDAVLLERDAPVVTGGHVGDAYLITMRRNESAPPSDVVLAFAERAQLRLEARAGWSSLGMRGTQSVALKLSGTLSQEQLIDPPGGFKRVAVTSMIPVGHLAWAACWVGAAQGAYRQVIALLRDPRARAGFDLQSDLMSERLARVRMQIDVAEAYLHQVTDEYLAMRDIDGLDGARYAGPSFNVHINNLKVLASESSFEAVDQLMQIAGLRFGFLKNPRTTLERTFRDLRSARLMYTNDRLLVSNGKLALVDRDAYGER